MSIRDFIESSQRAGLIPKVVHRELDEISRLALPSVLILKDDSACILLDFNLDNRTAKVIMPEVSNGETTISLDELNTNYTNRVIIIKPSYNFKNRISDEIVSNCHQCGNPCDTHVNCANESCHLLFIQCNECKEKMNSCCSKECIDNIELSYGKQKSLRRGKRNSHKVFKKGRSNKLKFKIN